MSYKILISFLIFSALFSAPVLALDDSGFIFNNPVNLPGDSTATITGNIIQQVLAFVGVATLLLVIYAGFKWMTAQGNGEQIKSAQKIIVWALIGVFVVFSSYILLSFVFDVVPH